MCNGSSTFSCAESSGIRPNDWNTKPMSLLRSSTSSDSRSSGRLRPSSITDPAVGLSSPAMRFSRVVFPEPERPITARNSWPYTSMSMPSTAATAESPEPNTRTSPRTDMRGCPARPSTAESREAAFLKAPAHSTAGRFREKPA